MKNQSIRYYETCPKCFSSVTKQNFKRHFNACSGVGNVYEAKNLICQYCKKQSFSSLKDFKEHLKICDCKIDAGLDNRGRRKQPKGNFTCKFCGRLFENKRHCDLVLHENMCHQNPNRKNGNWKGRKHTVEQKIKIAQAVRNRLGENFRGFYNKEACEFIEKINLEKGFNFQHQLKGGEFQVGPYFLDGYDKERNIAFEFNEIGHYLTQEKIEKDEYRRRYIIKELNCEFFVFNDKEKQFEEYNNIGLVRTFKSLDEW